MKQIFRIFTLIAVAILTAGQAWAGTTADLGSIKTGTVTGGSLRFYKEATCQNEISTNSNLYSSDLTDGKVYIKATPDFGYKIGAADEGGKVTFITAEVTVGTIVAGARTRGTAPTVGVGDFIDVTATTTTGVYCITMPADKNLNVTVTAEFPMRPTTEAVSYIDPTKTGDAQNATTPEGTKVYILDGTETVLGSDDDTPTWYVVNENVNFDHAFEINNDVRIILANEKTMNIGSETSGLESYGIAIRYGSQLTIYGQGGTTEGSLNIYSNESSFYSTSYGNTITICGGHVVTSRNISLQSGTVNILGGTFTDEEAFSESAIPYSIQASEITIDGGAVSANGLLFAETNGITVNGGSVDVYQLVAQKGNITLGWTNAETDCIATTNGYQCNDIDGKLTFTTGKRFYAYDGENVAAVYDAQTDLTKDEYNAYPELVGKTLKPCEDIFVKLIDGVTASAEGGVSVTETWYKVASGADVTLSATDSENKKLSSVTLSDGTITITGSDGTFTFTMGTSDVTVTAATFLEKVSYIDPTATGDDKIKTVFATPLTGNETNLAEGWYVVNEDINYTTVSNSRVLTAKGAVNLILADGKTMNIGSAENSLAGYGIFFEPTAATLAIYGQGGTTEGSLNIYTANNINPISNTNGITLYGGNLAVNYMLQTDGTFTIHGGTFNNARTSGNSTAINAAEINICGGTVTSVNKLYGYSNSSEAINISGGVVDVSSLETSYGSIAISGGQVTIGEGGIYSKANLTLSWTDAESDYIAYGGKFRCEGGSISIASDKHFFDYDSENAIVAFYDAETLPELDNFSFYSFNGKTLKPAVKITLPTGVTATGTDVFTSATAGTYAKPGAEVSLSGSASEGKTISFTVKDADGTTVTVSNGSFTMPAKAVTVTANLTNIPATAPTISTQPSDLNLEWGYNSGNVLTVSASAATSHVLSYQWYSNSSNSTTGGSAIQSATSNSYTVPTGKNAGTTEYYYCVVTAKRSDNNETATTTSSVATVTVEDKQIESENGTTVTQDENGYSVAVNEGTGSGAVIDGSVLDANGKVTVASLTYDRTLTAPTTSNKDVTIGGQAAKLYTTCLPTIPATNANVKYYTLASVSGSTLHFTEVTSPAADTPYLMAVMGSSSVNEDVNASNVTLKKIVTGSSTSDGSYTMMGTQTGLSNGDAISAAGSSDNATYILQTGSKWGKVTSNASVYIPPFRAFIVGPDVTTTSGARELNSSFDGEAAGIDTLRLTDSDGTERWYDLNGRRIEKPTRKGVFIHGGRKEVIR